MNIVIYLFLFVLILLVLQVIPVVLGTVGDASQNWMS